MIQPTSSKSVAWSPKVLALSMLATSLAVDPALAQDDLPKGEQVVEEMIAASGGKAWEKLRNRVTKGTLEFVGMEIKGPLTVYEAAPNLQYAVITLEGVGKIENGTDGKMAWEISPMQGARLKEGEELAQTLREAQFHGLLHWRKLFKQAECVGREDVDGDACYKVVMTPTEGSPHTWYIDVKTHMVRKQEMTLKHAMAGELAIQVYLEDHRAVDDVMIPHKIRQVSPFGTHLIVVESVQHNVDLPKDRFETPEAVRALIKEQAETP